MYPALIHPLIDGLPRRTLVRRAMDAVHTPGNEMAFGCHNHGLYAFPAIAPSLAAAGLLVLLVSWSQYVLTLLIGGGTVVTLPILLFSTASGGDTAMTSALSLIYIAPVLALLAVASHRVSRLPPSRLARP